MCASRPSPGCSRAAVAYSCWAGTVSTASHWGPCEPRRFPDMSARTLPRDAPIRVVGDVHGDATAFAYAAATDRFVVQLGDLTDYGPDNAGTLRIMFRLIDEGRGLFLLGNHDLKLARFLAGHTVRNEETLDATLAQLNTDLRQRVVAEVAAAPSWVQRNGTPFVHGGFHTAILDSRAREPGRDRAHGVLARALYGERTGRIQPHGYPERSLRWVDRIPAGITVYCGHDRRSTDGRPYTRRGAAGGTAVFLDTGAGKGGHLSWIDL